MKRYLPFVAIILVVVVSCSKDEDTPAKTNTQLIASSSWKLDTAGIDANGDGTIDSPLPPGTLEDCDMDNIFTFREDKTGTVDEGALKCDPSGPQSADFTWSFNTSENVINFSDTVFSGFQGDLNIKSLTATSLVLSREVNVGLPVNVNVVVKLKH